MINLSLQILLTIFAITGAVLNILKNRLCFIIWTVANICGVILYFRTGLYVIIFVAILYMILNIIGWFKWKKEQQYI